jgi:hypothetical protein
MNNVATERYKPTSSFKNPSFSRWLGKKGYFCRGIKEKQAFFDCFGFVWGKFYSTMPN